MQVDFTLGSYFGFLAFLTIAGIGFWLMIFLLTYVIPYWLGGAIVDRIRENKELKNKNKEK